ncbi:MAG: galactose-1-phosphate uridylyltransferase, partial [Thermoproteota archaeon]
MELRWDPVLKEWIIVSGQRRKRPFLPESFCPFCPGSTEVPSKGWDVLSLPNRYPSLMPNPPPSEFKSDTLYRCKPAIGFSEIILYTPEHNTTLAELNVSHIKKLVDLWAERYQKLGEKRFVKYIFIFENKGREIGATLDHPHGQIYAFPFIPPKIKKELESSQHYMKRTGRCLFCQ